MQPVLRQAKSAAARLVFRRQGACSINNGFLKEGACQTVGSCSNELERMILVRDLAQQYANKCSIANFRKIISSSLSVTTSVCPGNNNNSSQEVATISNCKSIPKPPPTGKKGVSG